MPNEKGGANTPSIEVVLGEAKEMVEKHNLAVDGLVQKYAEVEEAQKEGNKDLKGLEKEILALKKQLASSDESHLKVAEYIEKMTVVTVKGGKQTFGQLLDTAVEVAKDQISKLFLKKGKADSTDSVFINLKGIVDIDDVVDSTLTGRVAGIANKPVRKISVEDLFSKKRMGENTRGQIAYTQERTLTRNAGQVNRCSIYPESDIDWEQKHVTIEKTATFIKICKDSLEDLVMLRDEIRDFILKTVQLQFDEQLLLGDGISPNIKGITTSAPDWAAGTLAGYDDEAGIYEVINYGATQIKASGQNNSYMPDYILMNPQDVYAMLNEKDLNGRPFFPRGTNIEDVRIGGAKVLENPLIPLNQAFIGDFSYGDIYISKDLEIEIASENQDDFIKDLLTMKASKRGCLLIKDVHDGAFLHVPSITGAITDLKTPMP